jgi:peptidoglycan/xylan/chitin deacetylase (PgdA/CDA1 family)
VHASKAILRSARRRLRSVWRGRHPIILTYHRITDGGEDPWQITISPRHLAQHFDVLTRRRRVIGLRQLVDDLSGGRAPRDAAVVTFDDGYADNLHVVCPLLERYGIPVTMFIIAGAVGRTTEFWWDELGRILLQPGRLPQHLRIEAAGRAHEWSLGDACDYLPERAAAHQDWRATEPPPTPRHVLYLALRELMWPIAATEQERLLGQIQKWAAIPLTTRPGRRFLAAEELAALAARNLVEIGAHGLTHASLPELSPAVREHEVCRSKVLLEDYLSRPVRAFAYPYGKNDAETVAAVRGAGFAYACTVASDAVRRAADPWRLPRFEMRDWDGEEFERRLSARFA